MKKEDLLRNLAGNKSMAKSVSSDLCDLLLSLGYKDFVVKERLTNIIEKMNIVERNFGMLYNAVSKDDTLYNSDINR